MIKRFEFEDFHDCLGITKHDYKSFIDPSQKSLTWSEVLQRVTEAANLKLCKGLEDKFKLGARIVVYIEDIKFTGYVVDNKGMYPGQIRLFIDGNDGALSVYPFECKRLRKKK